MNYGARRNVLKEPSSVTPIRKSAGKLNSKFDDLETVYEHKDSMLERSQPGSLVLNHLKSEDMPFEPV